MAKREPGTCGECGREYRDLGRHQERSGHTGVTPPVDGAVTASLDQGGNSEAHPGQPHSLGRGRTSENVQIHYCVIEGCDYRRRRL